MVRLASYAPTAKSAAPARATEEHAATKTPRKRNGTSGMSDPTSEETPTIDADRSACFRIRRREPVLFAHHHGHPDVGICRDRFDDAIEPSPLEALPPVDFADFVALEGRNCAQVAVLALAFAAVDVCRSEHRRVGHRRHRDRSGERGREPPGENDARTAAGGRDAQQDAEHVHDPVLTAEDEIGERSAPPVRVDSCVVGTLPLGDDFRLDHVCCAPRGRGDARVRSVPQRTSARFAYSTSPRYVIVAMATKTK